MPNVLHEEKRHDLIVVRAVAPGSVLAAGLCARGAQALLIGSGDPDDASIIANPNVWFYNPGGPPDYQPHVNPSPRLNKRTFNVALGHVRGCGAGIDVTVRTRGTQRFDEGWAKNGAIGWSFADVLPVIKSRADWQGGANALARRRRRRSHPSPKRSSSEGARTKHRVA